LLWLLGWLRPDFKTIADLWGDNRAAFKAVLWTFVLLRRKLDLFRRELLTAEGARLKSVNGCAHSFTGQNVPKHIKSADERLETAR